MRNAVDSLAAAEGFSGVVRVDRGDDIELAKAYGLAHRAHAIANTLDTQFAIASGTKGLTALTVVSLIEEGALDLSTTARSVLGEDLPLIDDDVTIEHLLAHRSGIGDYLDEDAVDDITDYVLPVPVHELATTEQYLRGARRPPGQVPTRRPVRVQQRRLRGARTDRRAGERHAVPRAVRQRVCEPAGMRDTAFLRSDELPVRAALGYLRRRCDRGPTSSISRSAAAVTAASTRRLADISTSGRRCSPVGSCRRRPSPDGAAPQRRAVGVEALRPGLLAPDRADAVMLEGYDAGVSFRSVHDPARG